MLQEAKRSKPFLPTEKKNCERTTAFWNEYSILKGSRVHYRRPGRSNENSGRNNTQCDDIRMVRSKRISLLIGVLILATFLRFYHLTTIPPGLFVDEAMNGNNAVEVHETGQFKVLYPEFNGREGLYVNNLALLFNVFPSNVPWVIRLPAAVAGVLTVLGVYLFVVELFGDDPALLAAFLLATSFWHIIILAYRFPCDFGASPPHVVVMAAHKSLQSGFRGENHLGLRHSCRHRLRARTILTSPIASLPFFSCSSSRSFTKCRAFKSGSPSLRSSRFWSPPRLDGTS